MSLSHALPLRMNRCDTEQMIRKHLPATIALTAILSLVAGGLAYAALTPQGKVTACVSPDGFIRGANFNGKKCPAKTSPVLLDKSSSTGGSGGASTLRLAATSKNPDPKTFVGAYNHNVRINSPGGFCLRQLRSRVAWSLQDDHQGVRARKGGLPV